MQTKRIYWRDLNILYFKLVANTGDKFEFDSPVLDVTLDAPTVTLVTAGRFLGEAPSREPIEWPALPARTEGGMAFPGRHTLTALEDNSVYQCVCPFLEIIPKDSLMYKLDHIYIPEARSITFSGADGYKAVIAMTGAVTTPTGEVITGGHKVDVGEGAITLEAQAGTHLVGYRLKQT